MHVLLLVNFLLCAAEHGMGVRAIRKVRELSEQQGWSNPLLAVALLFSSQSAPDEWTGLKVLLRCARVAAIPMEPQSKSVAVSHLFLLPFRLEPPQQQRNPSLQFREGACRMDISPSRKCLAACLLRLLLPPHVMTLRLNNPPTLLLHTFTRSLKRRKAVSGWWHLTLSAR